jgi:hypothetical protein
LDQPIGYPVGVEVEPQTEQRNRLTAFFRILLAIPHVLLVGGPVWYGLGSTADEGPLDSYLSLSSLGMIGAVLAVMTIIVWFAILFTGRHPQPLWELGHFYLRWRTKAVAYVTLLRDEYPPFGDADYPAAIHLERPETRNRLSVGFRLFLLIPHAILLLFLGIAWGVTTLIAWLAILFTGRYPQGLYDFGLGVMRWDLRVEAYAYLLRDEYPPFTLRA